MTIKKALVGLVLAFSLCFPVLNVFAQDPPNTNPTPAQIQKQETDPRIQRIISFILENGNEDFNQRLQDFFSVMYEAKLHFVDEKTFTELLTLAMKGLVSNLDSYSNLFVDKEAQEMLKLFSEDQYSGGVGMFFQKFGIYICGRSVRRFSCA